MCEIFPEVKRCCMCIPLRVGLLLIAVVSITTGVIIMCVLVQVSNVTYKKIMNVTKITAPKQVLKQYSNIVNTGLSVMAFFFIFIGMLLLFSTLMGSEGFIQVFVWLMFLNVVLGFIMVVGVAFECILYSRTCLLKDLDWLSASTFLVVLVSYMFVWIYYIAVGNSYVLNGDM